VHLALEVIVYYIIDSSNFRSAIPLSFRGGYVDCIPLCVGVN